MDINPFISICQRWDIGRWDALNLLGYTPESEYGSDLLTGHEPVVSEDTKLRISLVIGISLGLGALFDENLEAERAWIRVPREALNGDAPIDHMIRKGLDNIENVVDLLNKERGIY